MDYKDKIDPELRKTARTIPFSSQLVQMGNVYQAAAWKLAKIPRDVCVQTIETEGYQHLKYKTDVFMPAGMNGPMPALIYAHGGAFCYKAAVYHKKLACIYAAKAKCKVFFPDFHLAPKYPYPAALEDVRSLYRYVTEHAEEFGIDPDRIGLAGDSAGAAVAALISNQYERDSLPKPCLQMLSYPMTDNDMQTESMKKYTDTPFWNSQNHMQIWPLYFGGQDSEVYENGRLKDSVKTEALPMHSVLPLNISDTFIETAEYDCLHDEGILYAQRLREAGADVELYESKGTFHGYDMALNTKIVTDAVKKRLSFLRRHF